MARATLQTIEEKLINIQAEITELKHTKVGTDVWQVQLHQVEKDISEVKKDVENINGYGKWIVLLVLGAVMGALLNLVIKT